MLRILTLFVFSLMVVSCASAPSAEQSAAEAASEPLDELQPVGGDGSRVCGWAPSGRWECKPGKPKKAASKFGTKFKKGPPKEKESKLPRGDAPFDSSPIDDGGG